jgi:hypothetical protein
MARQVYADMDGNCNMRALAQLLVGSAAAHVQLRKMCVAFDPERLAADEGTILQHLEHEYGLKTIAAYREYIARPCTWAGDLEMLIIGGQLDVCIYVWSVRDLNGAPAMKLYHRFNTEAQRRVHLLYDGAHYSGITFEDTSMVRRAGRTAAKASHHRQTVNC